MSPNEAEIGRLMARGLDLYGLGQVREATECWRRVLALDPEHAEARDFLQTAGGESEAVAAPASGDAVLVEEAVALLRRGQLAEGLDLLESVAGREPGRLDVQAFVELARAALLRVYRRNVGSGERTPRVRISTDQVLKYNLPASAGFLLSLIDGHTSIDELLALSGMDPFEVLRGVSNLLDAGIVEAAT
jgi:tetratricopeptide (TPR) repeat protein